MNKKPTLTWPRYGSPEWPRCETCGYWNEIGEDNGYLMGACTVWGGHTNDAASCPRHSEMAPWRLMKSALMGVQ